jgi:hypothetical protein
MSTHTLNNASINSAIHTRIRDYFDCLLDDGCLWQTPYGTFARRVEDVFANNTWLNTEYKILLHRVDNYVMFAIVPPHVCETSVYDGFACTYGDLDTVPNEITEKYLCPTHVFNNDVVNNALIVMYIE